MRVVHVVESLGSGAVEGWLLTMLRTARKAGIGVDWTFYCVLPGDGTHDAAARALGATVLHSPVEMHDTISFVGAMREALDKGRFDILHCHHDIVSALYLIAALGLPISKRIVHAHNADLGVPTSNRFKAALLRPILRRMCLSAADCIVGISNHTLETLLGRPSREKRCETVVYYGIDTSLFHGPPPDRSVLLESLNLPKDSEILLFAGRMVWYKNPMFVLDVLECLRRTHPKAIALFAGTGPLTSEVDRVAIERGMAEAVRVLGWRDDTYALMQIADVFVFPRVEQRATGFGIEGLGLVVVEAQAAGLRALLSRGVPDDAVVIREQCEFLTVSEGPDAWAQRLSGMLARPRPRKDLALAAIDASRFSAAAGLASLQRLYAA